MSQDEVPENWEIGEVILDLYEVTGILGKGAMGKVYKVRHRNWNMDLAVKSPHFEYYSKGDIERNFVREAETWEN